MISALVTIPSLDTDTAEVYMRRRNREISKVQRSMGKWSTRWAKLQIGWYEHLVRDRNAWSWAAQILTIRPPEELEERRLEFGRARTRAHSGWVRARWTECIDEASKNIA